MLACLACMHSRSLTSTPLLRKARARHLSSRWLVSNTQSGSVHSLRADLCTSPEPNQARKWIHTRSLTSAPAKKKPSLEVPLPKHQTLTLLHKTTTFLSGVLAKGLLAKGSPAESVSSLDFWNGALSEVYNEISVGEAAEAKVRVALYGVDEWSGAQDLITALLEDPLASTEQQIESLRNRWQGLPEGQESLIIDEGTFSLGDKGGSGILQGPCPWFHQFLLPVQVIEMAHLSTNSPSSPPTPTRLINPALFKADIPILVFNPLTTPLSSLLKHAVLFRNPNAIILLTSIPTSYTISQHLHLLLSDAGAQPPEEHESKATYPLGARVLFVDPNLALGALKSLRSDPKAARNIMEYKTGFLNSNLSAVNHAISEVMKERVTIAELRTQTALTIIELALKACKDSFKRARWDIDVVCARVSELRAKVEEAKVRVKGDVLGRDGMDEVEIALERASKEMKRVMDDLTWWKMIWRVDEIGEIVGNAVRRVWCKELEEKLLLHTGRLAALQTTLTSSTTALPALLPSPVLQNSLSQLSSSPSYHLQASTLTMPIHVRQHQLISYPTTRLHLAGQSAVLGTLGGLLGGTGLAAYLLEFGSGAGMAGASTTVGTMMLCTLLGIRWAVGKWERAKKRWWEDWSRVGEGLGRDLEEGLNRTMNEKVVLVADRAAEGLDSLVQKRKEELEGITEELGRLDEELVKVQVAERS